MRRTLLLVAIVSVLAAGISFSVSRWVTTRRQPLPVMRVYDAAWLKRELNLTGNQTREVEKHAGEFQAKIDAFCVAHCAARFALGDELAKSQVDVEKARACVDKMNAVQAEAEKATLEHILKIRALLTEEQAQRYSAIIHQQVCSMPMGAY
jgi:Spy/CpxP family protein refolding chaperone